MVADGEEFIPLPKGGPLNPIEPAEPSKAADVMVFGLVPGLIINKLRQGKAAPDERLSDLSFRQLADLEDQLKDLLEETGAPEQSIESFRDGYDCHMRLMRWMTEQGERGDAIRHAMDAQDGERLLWHLNRPIDHEKDLDFILGFQAANGDLARRFEDELPD